MVVNSVDVLGCDSRYVNRIGVEPDGSPVYLDPKKCKSSKSIFTGDLKPAVYFIAFPEEIPNKKKLRPVINVIIPNDSDKKKKNILKYTTLTLTAALIYLLCGGKVPKCFGKLGKVLAPYFEKVTNKVAPVINKFYIVTKNIFKDAINFVKKLAK